VVKGGPADKAGLKKDDLIIAYQGKEISDSGILRNEVANTAVGKEVTISVLRSGKKEELTAKIANLEELTKILMASAREHLGAEVRSLTPQEIEKYGLNANQGVAIRWLDAKGPLGVAGFEVEDVILGIDNQPVGGVDSFLQMVSVLKANQKVPILVLDHRSGNTGTILVMVR
jgi:serine protease Do